MSQQATIHKPIQLKELPHPIFHHLRSRPKGTIYPAHKHDWGEFVFSFSGILEMKAEGKDFRVPPNFGLWHPPFTEHHGCNSQASFHSALYIDKTLAEASGMPKETCALLVNPMVRAMLEHLRLHPPQLPYSATEQKLLEVILDQLVETPIAGCYLPDANDILLNQVLTYLKTDPGNNCSLQALAHHFGASERTLARKAQRELGMALSEWRQRLKVMHAIPMLENGVSVESVALDLGYSSASAFIVMFRRLLDTTPDEYRRNGA